VFQKHAGERFLKIVGLEKKSASVVDGLNSMQPLERNGTKCFSNLTHSRIITGTMDNII
jgi:hypothetical protein